MSTKKAKSTRAFRDDMIIRRILPYLKWIGSSMLFPYWWNGERRFARLHLNDLIKIIEWDVEL